MPKSKKNIKSKKHVNAKRNNKKSKNNNKRRLTKLIGGSNMTIPSNSESYPKSEFLKTTVAAMNDLSFLSNNIYIGNFSQHINTSTPKDIIIAIIKTLFIQNEAYIIEDKHNDKYNNLYKKIKKIFENIHILDKPRVGEDILSKLGEEIILDSLVALKDLLENNFNPDDHEFITIMELIQRVKYIGDNDYNRQLKQDVLKLLEQKQREIMENLQKK